jgi:hypothetical protein
MVWRVSWNGLPLRGETLSLRKWPTKAGCLRCGRAVEEGNRNDVQAVIKIFAEGAVLDALFSGSLVAARTRTLT